MALKDVFNWLNREWNYFRPGYFQDKLDDISKAWDNVVDFFSGHNSAYTDATGNITADLSNASMEEGLNNAATGNLDYARSLDTLAKEQAFNADQAQIARDFEAEQAQIVRDYQERLANTAYQRQVADLSAAGYNPALVLSAGGASSPSASIPSAYQASVQGSSVPRLGKKAVENIFALAKILVGVNQNNAMLAFENKKLSQNLDILSKRLDLTKERIDLKRDFDLYHTSAKFDSRGYLKGYSEYSSKPFDYYDV